MLFGHGNVHHAGGEQKRNQPVKYSLYLIRLDVGLKDVVSSAYDDSTSLHVQNPTQRSSG